MIKLGTLTIIFAVISVSNEMKIFDFSPGEIPWRSVNDNVMGGVSNGKFRITEKGTAEFTGTLRHENNGGFASARSVIPEKTVENYLGVVLRVKGDGLTYNLTFRTDKAFDGISYQAKFKTEKNKWQEIRLPFEDFGPKFRGRIIPNQPELLSEDIEQIGILVADKQFGPFSIELDWIKFYKEK